MRYCLKAEVHVHSGLPILREKRQSRCRIVSGKTASIPEGSTDAEPDGIRIRIVGGESSKTSKGQYIEKYVFSVD